MTDVLIVGAGIVGASLAYHAARAGAAVTLVDGGQPASGVTGRSFAWIGNTSGGWPGGSDDLRRHIWDDYRRLERDLAGVVVRRSGSLSWAEGATEPPSDTATDEQRQVVGASEIAVLEPNLLSPPRRAVYIPTDGGVDPVQLTFALVRAARDHGARVVLGEPVLSIDRSGDHVVGVSCATRRYRAATVVLAAGTAVPGLCAPLGLDVPVHASPALILHATAPAGIVKRVVATGDFEVREVAAGRLVMTAALGSAVGRLATARAAIRAVELMSSAFEGGQDVRLAGHHIGQRPMTGDNGPIIGGHESVPGLYLAVMHSAVCLAPTVGRLVVGEILNDQLAPELARCRINRFDR